MGWAGQHQGQLTFHSRLGGRGSGAAASPAQTKQRGPTCLLLLHSNKELDLDPKSSLESLVPILARFLYNKPKPSPAIGFMINFTNSG